MKIFKYITLKALYLQQNGNLGKTFSLAKTT